MTRRRLSRRMLLAQLSGLFVGAGAAVLGTGRVAARGDTQVGPWAGRNRLVGTGARLTGRVVTPADPTYGTARRAFNGRLDVSPALIVFCQHRDDVVRAVQWARARGMPFSVRSGGHSYEGFSLSPGLIIDLSELSAIAIDRTRGVVTAGAGMHLIDFYEALALADLSVPAGSCATVGLAGLTLGGGFGLISRKFGLTSDNLLEVEVVDATGTVLIANASQHADLFWACRGGGGSFGIVTSLTFQAHAVGDVVLFRCRWPLEQAGAVLAAWQTVAPFWPDELTCLLRITGTTTGTVSCTGVFVGPETDLRALLTSFLLTAPTDDVTASTMPYIDACRALADETAPPQWKAKSDYAAVPLSDQAIATITRFMAASPHAEDFIQFDNYGGAVNRVPRDATAFPHRAGTLFSMQYLAYWTELREAPASLDWLAAFYAAMRPHTSGYAYSNYCDLDLPDWEHAYYGANFEALVDVKTAYDPQNIFRFAQSIPPRALPPKQP